MKKEYAVYYHLIGKKQLRRASVKTFKSLNAARVWAKKNIPSPFRGRRVKYKKVKR